MLIGAQNHVHAVLHVVIARRPDLKRVRELASASALTAAATGDLYPRVSLGGLFGLRNVVSGPSGMIWSIAGGLTAPLINFGRFEAQVDIADARRQQSYFAYRQAVLLALASLDRLDQLVPALREMGRAHAGYGVRDEHYATVGAALLDTLAAGLKEALTPDVKEAWLVTYTVLANAMKQGAADLRPLEHATRPAAAASNNREPVTMRSQHKACLPRDTPRQLEPGGVEIDRLMKRARRLRARYLHRVARLLVRMFLRWSRQLAIGIDAKQKNTAPHPLRASSTGDAVIK